MDADEGGEFHRTGNFWKAAQLFWCGFFPHYVGDDVFLRGYDLLASHRIRHDSGGGESVLRRKRSNGSVGRMADPQCRRGNGSGGGESELQRRCSNGSGGGMPVRPPCVEFLESQHSLCGIPYGATNMAEAGCGILAVYNLLLYWERPESLTALIHEAEMDGSVLRGRWGTSTLALLRMLRRRGLTVMPVTGWRRRETDFDSLLRTYDSFLMNLYNDEDDIRAMVHTVCVTRLGPDRFRIHNADGERSLDVEAASVRALCKAQPGGKARPILLAGVFCESREGRS